jgi:hypothetical protein
MKCALSISPGRSEGDPIMRYGIVVAAAALAFSATAAKADEWCGYTAKDDAVIECGYTTASECSTAVGKGGTCFVDPDIARNIRRATPMLSARFSPIHG